MVILPDNLLRRETELNTQHCSTGEYKTSHERITSKDFRKESRGSPDPVGRTKGSFRKAMSIKIKTEARE